MIVFEVVKPGYRINTHGGHRAHQLGILLDNLINIFFEANLALNLFIHETSSSEKRILAIIQSGQARFSLRNKERQTMRAIIENEYKERGLDVYQHFNQIQNETQTRINRRAWERGETPREFTHQKPFMYAKCFLFALDSFEKFLCALSKEEGAPESLTRIHGEINEKFPTLREVRNSAHHLEDRIRGIKRIDRAGKRHPLVLKPVDNKLIQAKQGIIALNNLNGSFYGCTMADGNYGEIDVSAESLEKLQSILHEVINAFPWIGSPETLPCREN
ncbi:hypothetical protein [Erwinia billingiae]|uniref:hypothetical protein n=1 Tax=Erwinia billingiae TaxID=182337 RepID=UPI003209CFA9